MGLIKFMRDRDREDFYESRRVRILKEAVKDYNKKENTNYNPEHSVNLYFRFLNLTQ